MKLKPVTIFQVTAFVAASGFLASAQAPVLITQPVNESQLTTLVGNTRPEAIAANDQGRVSDNLPIGHMLLQLRRSPQQEQTLEALIDQMHDASSPNYHQWLAAPQFGQLFGLSRQDLTVIAGWLELQGFAVNTVYPSGMLIDFSGTAGQVRNAFHTEIHNLLVNGAPHIANMSNPRIPEALAPAISGIVSLHDFRPSPMYTPRANFTVPEPGFTNYLVAPTDLAVIYNVNPLFAAQLTGTGQTVAVVEDSDLFSDADWSAFRTTFGLSRFTRGNLVTVNPPSSGTNNCSDPGVNGNFTEAAIDVEYASATAPGATIELASCSDTTTTFGGLIAIENMVNAAPPSIISMSYGQCEAINGAAANSAFNMAFQQAVTEGVSIFVSSGDEAGAGCDRGGEDAVHGIGVTGWGETPYNVSVGGTDFGDSALGVNALYWNSTNTQYYESALSYIPEIPWNGTCGSALLAGAFGYSQTFGLNGLCNSSIGSQFLGVTGGSGGPSLCATGAPLTYGVVSGTCQGYPKPAWQKGLAGVPQDGVRDIPDVSLFAANGLWGHYYPVCISALASCSGTPDTWPGFGGTSVSSPVMAGIQALVNEKYGKQGNPNYVYYKLAANEYGTTGAPGCVSTLGRGASSSCTFYDVTLGDMDVPCTIGVGAECYKPAGVFGVLSGSSSQFKPAFAAHGGWDYATGIGSVNAANLVNNWKSVAP